MNKLISDLIKLFVYAVNTLLIAIKTLHDVNKKR